MLKGNNFNLLDDVTVSNKAKYRYNNFTSPASAEKENCQTSIFMEHMDSKAETLKVRSFDFHKSYIFLIVMKYFTT